VRALVHHGPGDFAVEDRPEPRPGPGELLLRPAHVGLCVTDRHVYDGRGFGRPWPDGLVIGHEFSALVHEVGAELDGWAAGDRVVVDPRFYCHDCAHCRGGLMTLCERGAEWIGVGDGRDGAFAELVVAPAYGCFRLPDAVSDEAGALGEPLAAATRAVRLSGFAVDDNVAIVGAEDYGLLALQRLRYGGAGSVVVLDGAPGRARSALALGATATVDPAGAGSARAVRDLMPHGADLVFVAMEDYVQASADYLRLAFRVCRVQGTVVILRAYGREPYAQIAPEVPLMKELTIRHFGAFFGEEPLRGGRPRGDWQTAIDALARGDARVSPGTVVVDFEDLSGPRQVEELMHLLPDKATKVLVRVAGQPSR
jgi:threonine dehydrogenase-like Zn-dependent dehydrogenase